MTGCDFSVSVCAMVEKQEKEVGGINVFVQHVLVEGQVNLLLSFPVLLKEEEEQKNKELTDS